MRIETRLAMNNMKTNKKRTLYTAISLTLCTTLILTTILLISSIRNGVSENSNNDYNDYHIILKDLTVEKFNKIKNKPYIEKMYIQQNEEEPLKKVNSSYSPEGKTTVYLKYKNINKICEYTDDILEELDLSQLESLELFHTCKFNKKLLTMHGFIDVYVGNEKDKLKCMINVNYSHIINLMIIIVIITFSVLFIIVLYNAFLITISERKKEYAVLNSTGGTEGQILKMVFTEAILMGIIAMLFGSMFSILLASNILNDINEILNKVEYYFKLTIDLKYIILAIVIICVNIYLSALIPSVKASSTSVIEGIKNNKEIKNKKRKTVLERILPVEGKIAIKNIRRDGIKYKFITFLLVTCITIFILISTYVRYEKETSDLVNEYDVDARLALSGEYEESEDRKVRMNYKTILENYEKQYGKKIEYIEYKDNRYLNVSVESMKDLITNNDIYSYICDKKTMRVNVITLDEKSYNRYIEKIDAEYGDAIIYNNILVSDLYQSQNEIKRRYSKAFDSKADIKLELIFPIYTNYYEIINYNSIDCEKLIKKCILTDELLEGYKDIKTAIQAIYPTMFINEETYNNIINLMEQIYNNENDNIIHDSLFWMKRDDFDVKIKCDDIVEFKKYIDGLFEKYNLYIPVEYYSLENLEKTIYIEIIELISKIIITAIIIVGIVSTINTINASLIERKEDFNIMYRMGATKGNIKKILIYECIYMFVKALIISIILSIPIVYKIIKETEKVLVLDKLLIPFGSIGMFIGVMFVISLIITLLSTKMIKEE